MYKNCKKVNVKSYFVLDAKKDHAGLFLYRRLHSFHTIIRNQNLDMFKSYSNAAYVQTKKLDKECQFYACSSNLIEDIQKIRLKSLQSILMI